MLSKSVYEYPHLIALLVLILFGGTLGLGTGAFLAAWYCACMMHRCGFRAEEPFH